MYDSGLVLGSMRLGLRSGLPAELGIRRRSGFWELVFLFVCVCFVNVVGTPSPIPDCIHVVPKLPLRSPLGQGGKCNSSGANPRSCLNGLKSVQVLFDGIEAV